MAEPSITARPGSVRRSLLLIRSNWISAFGGIVALFGVIALATTLILRLTGQDAGPYDAILTILALPLLIVFGLVLIPIGLAVYRKRLAERLEQLADRPVSLARAVAGVTIVNLVAIGLAGQTGLSYMSSNQFCGTTCHVQMEPEHVTFLDSPHAQTKCVDCHVGPTASEQVSAKLNGLRQLAGTITGDWKRPIPTPVRDLPAARDSCGRCHWPEKYLGAKLVVHSRFRDDRETSGYTNVLLMRTGGTHPDGKATGIHWHTNPRVSVDFVTADEGRMDVRWIKSVREDGSERIFTVEGTSHDAPPEGHARRMDCTDCHNRTGHDFDEPGDAIDRAIAAGLIPRSLPFIKKIAVEVLHTEFARVSAERSIQAAMRARYESEGLLDERTRPLVDKAAAEVARIWERNIYPERAQTWGTYVDLKSHAGCFRCHDGDHRDQEGEVLTNRCDACHVVLSEQEEDPAILRTLGVDLGR